MADMSEEKDPRLLAGFQVMEQVERLLLFDAQLKTTFCRGAGPVTQCKVQFLL